MKAISLGKYHIVFFFGLLLFIGLSAADRIIEETAESKVDKASGVEKMKKKFLPHQPWEAPELPEDLEVLDK
jgi:hypothetical protein